MINTSGISNGQSHKQPNRTNQANTSGASTPSDGASSSPHQDRQDNTRPRNNPTQSGTAHSGTDKQQPSHPQCLSPHPPPPPWQQAHPQPPQPPHPPEGGSEEGQHRPRPHRRRPSSPRHSRGFTPPLTPCSSSGCSHGAFQLWLPTPSLK